MKSIDKKYIGTIFCDLDGTIVKHVSKGTCDFSLLPGAKEKLQEWKEKGYYIMITTGRKNTEEIAEYLLLENVPFNYIFGGLPSGERIIINDRKPHDPFRQMADSFEVERDKGIKDIEISPKPEMEILKRFRNGSFSKTLSIKKDNKLLVRKIASKTKNLDLGYCKLKKQHLELLRFNRIIKGITPTVYGDHENSYEYYYDIEYLKFYKPLHELPEIQRREALNVLFNSVLPRIYSYTTKILDTFESESWLLDHLSEKIYPVLDIDNLNEVVVIEIKNNLNEVIKSNIFHPKFICPIHGDLTYENIMYNPDTKDLKLIDLDGANTLDPPELDLGKLLQSCDCQYEKWSKIDDPKKMIYDFNMGMDNRMIFAYYQNVLDYGKEEVRLISEFYTALHLIRMVPFRLKVSQVQADFALRIANDYLKLIKERLG